MSLEPANNLKPNASGPATLNDVWHHDKAWQIYTMDFSFNFITQVLELLLHYQMALVFLTSSSFTAATCIIAGSAAIASLLVSMFLAPYLNRVLSEKQLGSVLPLTLTICGALFLALVFMPGVFASGFAAIGLPGVNIILLSCIVGAIFELVKNSIKYPISDVFINNQWKQITDRGIALQKTSNFFSGKPAKACGALLLILLTTLSATGVINLMWVVAPVLALFFLIWFRAVRIITADIKPDPEKACEESKAPQPEPTSFFTHIRDKKFQVIVSIGVLCTLGSAFLLTLKNTIIVSAAGAGALPYLKALILPAIWIANEIMGRVEARYKNHAFLIFLFSVNALLITFTVLYPYAPLIHAFCFTCGFLPGGPSMLLQFWMFSLFYITIEVWASAASERIYKPLQTKAFTKDELKTYLPSISIVFCVSQILAMGATLMMAELALPVATMLAIATGVSVFCAIGTALVYRYGVSEKLIDIDPIENKNSPVSSIVVGKESEAFIDYANATDRSDAVKTPENHQYV
jgi:ATP/ADP translocase